MTDAKHEPVHPGEVLLEDFLKPMGISRYTLARATGMPAQRIGDIVRGRRAMTADTALRLARYFDMEPEFWLNLQMRYELDRAVEALGERLAFEVQPAPR